VQFSKIYQKILNRTNYGLLDWTFLKQLSFEGLLHPTFGGGFERDFTDQFYTIISTDLAILF